MLKKEIYFFKNVSNVKPEAFGLNKPGYLLLSDMNSSLLSTSKNHKCQQSLKIIYLNIFLF